MSRPFSEPSSLPYQLPPFAEITEDDYLPACDEGFAEQIAEVAAITANPQPATFENTIAALERSGRTLARVAAVFYTVSSADSTERLDEIETVIAPRFAAHGDAITLNSALYERIRAVWSARHELDADERYLTEKYYDEATLAGAGLPAEQREVLSTINARLAALSAQFDQNLLADASELAVIFDNADELDGLDSGQLSAAAEAAAARGLDGKYVITLVLFTGHPTIASIRQRSSRERIMRASQARGARDGERDNRPLVREITRLRAERARLLGAPNHAAWVAADNTAKTPEAIAAMLDQLAPAAARNARAEADTLAERARRDGIDELASWDWAYYAEAERAETYAVDTAAMKPYFELSRVLTDGVFYAASRLYGLRFVERFDLPTYHDDVRVWEVFEEDGRPLGLFLGDYYARDSKRGGAWMNSLVDQSELLETPHAVVINTMNIPKPAAGEPTLLTFDEVETAFHEFGHALHGLLAHVTYPKAAGTSVDRDFVEFPSQVNEMWMLWPEVLANYARHIDTGEPLPTEWVQAIERARGFNQGFETVEYLAAALIDQAWHKLSPEGAARVTDVASFEAAALAAAGLDLPEVPPRYASTYFQHTFAGGYDAGYYSYIWSEVLDADTVEWFTENGGLTRANGEHFRATLLGVGGSADPMEAYRRFRGRDAQIGPLLRRRGLDDRGH